MKWHNMHYREVIGHLRTGAGGLGTEEAAKRLVDIGANKLAEKKKTHIIVKFFEQLNDFMIIVLLAAAATSVGMSIITGDHDFIDPLIILAIVVLNAVLGIVQEAKAEKSLEALKKMSVQTVKVIRGGKLQHISSEELVPGDIITLESGDYVPADARLLTSVSLKAEESALTGESLPVEKEADAIMRSDSATGDMRNMVFAGSAVTYGRGTAVVCETGMKTQVGKIAGMIMQSEAPETPLQKRLEQTGRQLGIGALIVCLVIFLLGILRHISPFEMFMTSVSLAVAAIPEGLPAIVTIMLAIGVQRLAVKNAIIRKLPAVETLGSASVICSDKTGTLTQNKMKVTEVRDTAGEIIGTTDMKRLIIKLACLCSDAQVVRDGAAEAEVLGEPTEKAIVSAALQMHLDKPVLEAEQPRVAEIPFDSARKLMTTLHRQSDGTYILITKGAPDVLFTRCTKYVSAGKELPLSILRRADAERQNTLMANKALRVIGVAYKNLSAHPATSIEDEEAGLTLAGLIGMMDPPRKEVYEAVAVCKAAGIRPVMITGDHVATANAIAKKIGIMDENGKALTGQELSVMTPETLQRTVCDYSVFARVSPEHKVNIVKALQANGAIVAMTGDGVNDAPALKAADIGCAMGISGTDVAKGAADMVLTDDNFATIVEAVRQGRGIYANIKKAVQFLLSSNIGEIITIFTAIFMGWQTPLAAIQLLWVNLVTDSLPAVALGMDPPERDVMKKKPYGNKKSLFADGLFVKIALEGAMIGIIALVAFGIGTICFDSLEFHKYGRTMAFATLSISQLFHAFNMKSDKTIFGRDFFNNVYLFGALVVGIVMQVSVVNIKVLSVIFKAVPLDGMQWGIVFGLSVLPIVIVELQKWMCRKREG